MCGCYLGVICDIRIRNYFVQHENGIGFCHSLGTEMWDTCYESAAHRIYTLSFLNAEPRKCSARSQIVFEDAQYLVRVLKIFATRSLHRSVNFGEVLPGAGWGSALLWAA